MNSREIIRNAIDSAIFDDHSEGELCAAVALAMFGELERRINAGELGFSRGLLFENAIAEMRRELE